MQRLRQLAARRPGARRGRCSLKYASQADVKTSFRLREFRPPGQIRALLCDACRTGTPGITRLCFCAGGAAKRRRFLRNCWENLDACSKRRVIHSTGRRRNLDRPCTERVTMMQSPQSHTLGPHRPVDNCELSVETFPRVGVCLLYTSDAADE